ncbi:DEAD/DEAH box helicase [Candidatus Atelocyanobacterium thalassae]|uniref:RNA helicase n=2 Tax=Candidatus Atelocyanobacterium thalassae TaxID=713887 RepID=A0A086CGE8_9CHRO|nr:DEAD/DEAH box helicase [Candidatus Atelocyanobacterium thalassa]KFF41262.1 MAG: DNA/RNA helicase, superfamily II [Candidatus Atelocyanobacterium thalassa isolate SIO64986]BDA40066.1 RNA helicase CrhR [cyanobacterium endosymbiont of Braarudosphaera bigelowii]
MTISFENLGLSEIRVNKLKELGFENPTEIQEKAIPLMLEGHDVLGQSQTGTGKTAAYSLPILEQVDIQNPNVQVLILTPTRELAQQVAEALKEFAVERRLYILTVYGGQSIDRQIRSLERGVQIVVGTPGRVIDLLERKKLILDSLSWAVLDEADEMLSMGFIDDVKTILKKTPEQRNTACFSATMPREIRELVNQFLKSPVTISVEKTQAAPTRIEQNIYMVPRGWSKRKALQPVLEIEDPESAIIFVRTKQTASDLTTRLQEIGHCVDEYHGNLSQSQRERLVHRFRDGRIKLVVATDIAARGLDVEGLSHVINYDLPDNSETYIHRIGRTGRAGKTGKAISIVESIDRRMIRQIERKLRQKIDICKIPSRSEVEAKRLEKLQNLIKESLVGERMASFLPLVSDLSTEYDPQAIAAAALQMIYDQDCPDWMKTDWEVPEATTPKPVVNRKSNKYSSKNSKNNRSISKSIRKTVSH